MGFDFDGATFSHIDNRVTFEVLMVRFGLTGDALNGLGMLVHYLDVGGVQPPKPLALKVYWQDCVKALRMMTHYSQRPVRCLTVC